MLAWRSRARLATQPGDALRDEAVAPKTDRQAAGVQLCGYRGIAQAPRTFQYDPGPKATDRALRDCRAKPANSTFCAALTTNSCFFGRPRPSSISYHRTFSLFMQAIYDSED